jgi:hypothetical protein
MAELLLKIGPGANYEDGDVLCAFNRRAIRCVHAQHLCHLRTAPRNASGLLLTTSIAHDWYEATHQYRFERISANQIRRTVIATGESEVFGSTPNAKGEAIDVRLFVRRRKLQADHYLFGEDGHEVWYGGDVDFSDKALDQVWKSIEKKTEHKERDDAFQLWPAGMVELRSHLFVPVDDFDDSEMELLVSSIYDETTAASPVLVHKRRHRANDLRKTISDLGVTEADVRDHTKAVDCRKDVAPLKRSGLFFDKKEQKAR